MAYSENQFHKGDEEGYTRKGKSRVFAGILKVASSIEEEKTHKAAS